MMDGTDVGTVAWLPMACCFRCFLGMWPSGFLLPEAERVALPGGDRGQWNRTCWSHSEGESSLPRMMLAPPSCCPYSCSVSARVQLAQLAYACRGMTEGSHESKA